MPVTTVSAATHITPVVIKTLFKHWRIKSKKIHDHDKEEVATDDIFFDEGFHIVKSFIELGTYNTIESLQAFTNTHVPAPPWAAVSPVVIPLSTCNQAADLLIDWFQPDELTHIVGGEKWWQVRGLDGIDGEWITEREFIKDVDVEYDHDRKLNSDEEDILKMEHLESVMLYVHGGAFFWGSINSHRYQIIRYARKFRGRAFAANYRKAPQYPWPCPLHDVLAAYLYLTDPPPGALHKAVKPEKIVLAGDSAGGGLCVSALCVLRDMGLQLPAGGVLISPWVDLTHSFPSIMHNTETDIIPPHGFIAKPSATWPVKPRQDNRVSEATNQPPPVPGHTDTLEPGPERIEIEKQRVDGGSEKVEESQEQMFNGMSEAERRDGVPSPKHQRDASSTAASVDSRGRSTFKAGLSDKQMSDIVKHWQPKPPKVLMENPEETPLELRSQIQLYAETEQLSHPLVSPVLQASLGNLCPLYILAGNGEVLRDEIIYLAHKASHPDEYPVREGVLRDSPRQVENIKNFTTPTKVHLQVFDDMCHVLTVFSYTDSAKYAYRSIAEFVKHVTLNSDLERSSFPEPVKDSVHLDDLDDPELRQKRKSIRRKKKKAAGPKQEGDGAEAAEDVQLYQENKEIIAEEVLLEKADPEPGRANHAAESLGISSDKRTSDIIMIRERVNIHGKVRPMEPRDQIPALQIPAEEVGLIKEAPIRKWLTGQDLWDKRFRRSAEKVTKQRRKMEQTAEKLLETAREQGLVLTHEGHGLRATGPQMPPRTISNISMVSSRRGFVDSERRYGPLDLDDERPPPTAIAKRKDTPEALALLRKSIYHTAPTTHNYVPKRKKSHVLRAAFDPHDHPTNAPQQSVSEQQVRAHIVPMHGMRIWDVLVGYFMRTNAQKARDSTKEVVAAITSVGDTSRSPS